MLRKDFSQGHAVMTMGIAALGGEVVARIVKTIEIYDDFCHENDPYEEPGGPTSHLRLSWEPRRAS